MGEVKDPIRHTIIPREVAYYPVTEDEIASLRTNTIVGDVLFMVASVLYGAVFGTHGNTTLLLIVATGALVGSMCFYWNSKSLISRIKKSGTPQSATAADKETRLLEALYGANETWIDVTERVVKALGAGGIVQVTNELAGQDPLPHVYKFLRVRYVVDDERFQKDFPEGTPLELPPAVI